MENETGVVDSPQDTPAVEDASTNDLRNFLAAQTESQVPQQELNLETQPEGANPPMETAEVIETPVEQGTEEERLAKRRIRPKSNEDQQVIDLYRSEGFDGSFQAAANIIYGQSETSQPVQPSAEPPRDPNQEQVDQISGIRGEIDDLTKQVEEASENLDTVQALSLQREIMNKELNIQKIETRQVIAEDRMQAEFKTTQRQKSTESREKAVSEYPDLNDNNSLYRKEFDNFVTQASNNPDYSPIFQSPKWPELMAREFGNIKGKQPHMQQQVVQQASQQLPPSVGNQARVLTSGSTAQPVNTNQSASDVTQLSNEQLYQYLGQSNGQRAPLR